MYLGFGTYDIECLGVVVAFYDFEPQLASCNLHGLCRAFLTCGQDSSRAVTVGDVVVQDGQCELIGVHYFLGINSYKDTLMLVGKVYKVVRTGEGVYFDATQVDTLYCLGGLVHALGLKMPQKSRTCCASVGLIDLKGVWPVSITRMSARPVASSVGVRVYLG